MRKLKLIFLALLLGQVAHGSYVVQDGSITTAKLHAGAVTSAKMDTNISLAGTLQLGGSGVTLSNNSGYLSVPGLYLVGGLTTLLVPVSNNAMGVNNGGTTAPAMMNYPVNYGLLMLRGSFNTSGVLVAGEGVNATGTHLGTGHYRVTFLTAFATAPTALCNGEDNIGGVEICQVSTTPNTTTVDFMLYNASHTAVDDGIQWMVIGPR